VSACCRLSRRQLLHWSGLVAASPFLSLALDPERAFAAPRRVAADPGPVVPMNLELVTLTETSAVLTWYTGYAGSSDEFGRLSPAPADTEVLLGDGAGNLRTVVRRDDSTPYHYVELTGLEPGRPYVYLARSKGTPALPSIFGAGNQAGSSTVETPAGTGFGFVTPQPPPGAFLFSLALCNDLHLGETTAGLVTSLPGVGGVPPGFTQVPGEPPYAEVMATSLVADARTRGASRLLAAGDITSEVAPKDVARAREILTGFGRYGTDWYVTRGNHDRSHSGPAYDACSPAPARLGAGTHDCFKDGFFPTGPTYFEADAFGLRLLGIDTYDKAGNGGDNGLMGPDQFAWLRERLAAEPDRPTVVFGHHPVSQESSVTTAEPVLFDLDPVQALVLEQAYASAPGVFLHHSGHTHRNRRTLSPVSPNVVFQEVSATKEYPGGFHLLRVFTGGYALNYYKLSSPLAKEWSERTRQEDFGEWPAYSFGSIADRNSVVSADLSGLLGPTSLAEAPLAVGLPLAGAAAGAAALALAARHGRAPCA